MWQNINLFSINIQSFESIFLWKKTQPLHVPTQQHSSSDSPFTNPYKNPPANRSPAPMASVVFAFLMAGTRTI